MQCRQNKRYPIYRHWKLIFSNLCLLLLGFKFIETDLSPFLKQLLPHCVIIRQRQKPKKSLYWFMMTSCYHTAARVDNEVVHLTAPTASRSLNYNTHQKNDTLKYTTTFQRMRRFNGQRCNSVLLWK